jgi:hypothetical protein
LSLCFGCYGILHHLFASGGNGSSTEALWRAVALLQHHDGVSGTSKQHVAYDYAQRLSEGSCFYIIAFKNLFLCEGNSYITPFEMLRCLQVAPLPTRNVTKL